MTDAGLTAQVSPRTASGGLRHVPEQAQHMEGTADRARSQTGWVGSLPFNSHLGFVLMHVSARNRPAAVLLPGVRRQDLSHWLI